MDCLKKDFQYALRRLAKNPRFVIVVVLTVGLCVGATIAIFSLVNGLLIRPLPYHRSDDLVRVWFWKGLHQKGVFLALRDGTKTLETVAAFTTGTGFNLTDEGNPDYIKGSSVSANLFSMLGVNAKLGRTFLPEEDRAGKDQVAILSYGIWKDKFGSDNSVLGRKITLNGRSREVVGVMPQDFHFPSPDTQVWVPVRFDQSNYISLWSAPTLNLIGRLRLGVSAEQALTEVRTMGPDILKMFPWQLPDFTGDETNVALLQQYLVSEAKPRLFMLLGAAAFILLIACINVATLLIATGVARQREISIRIALGANRWRIVRQLLTESIFLGIISSAFGLLIANRGLSLFQQLLPPDAVRLTTITIDWPLLAFTGGLTILTVLIFGLVPALESSSPDLQKMLKEGGVASSLTPRRKRLSFIFMVSQMAVAVMIVTATLLLVKSFWRLSQVNPGFNYAGVLTASITPLESLCDQPARCTTLYDELLARLRVIRGVNEAAAVNDLPLAGTKTMQSIVVEDHPLPLNAEPPSAQMFVTTPEYLNLMGIPLIRGRAFVDSDRADGTRPVLINESFSQHYWPDQDPIGKHIKPPNPKEWWTIVGVVGDVKSEGLDEDAGLQFYLPYGGFVTLPRMNLVMRTQGDPLKIAGDLRNVVSGIDHNLPVSNIRTLDEVAAGSMSARQSTMVLLTTFAVVAVILGALGIYSVASYSVSWRTHEIAIRMALGAQRREVLWLVIRPGLVLTLVGVAVGVAGAIMTMQLLRSLLFQVGPSDPQTLLVVGVLFASVSLLAVFLPARRAASLDPIIVLRSEL